jgi:hypothetical protein
MEIIFLCVFVSLWLELFLAWSISAWVVSAQFFQ